MTTATRTTSIVLTDEQATLLKQVASIRMLRGTAPTASVSEVVRSLVEASASDLRREVEGR